MKRTIIWIFLFTILSATVNAQCVLRFSGRVMDADTKEALKGATIQLKGLALSVMTDNQGVYLLEGLCPGHYDVVISHVGCETLETHIHIRNDYSRDYMLPHASTQLASVTVQGSGGFQALRSDLKERNLEASRGTSLGETLQRLNGVVALQTGSTIYKPVIQGLHSNRVLILNNGIRQESQQWGSEHAPEVDPYIANRVSVIRGASTLRYGSDAIGGVILVEPRLLKTEPGLDGEINLAGFSNNRMGVVSGILEGTPIKIKEFAWRMQGTIRRGGNGRTPDYWLANSGLSEYNFSFTAGYRKKNWGTEWYFSQFNTKLGIFSGSHIGNVTDLLEVINNGQPPEPIRSAGFTYRIDRPYQSVQHNLLKAKAYLQTGDIGRLNILASWQYNNRQEYDKKRFQSSEDVPQLDLSIGTAALDLTWDHKTIWRMRGTLGASGSYQTNAYSRRLFIPNYRTWNLGLFWIEQWEKNGWILDGGIRYDIRSIFETNTNDGKLYPDQMFQNLSGNFGIGYKWSPEHQVKISINTAWRPPAIHELYVDGLHHGAARLEKGDSSLLPERSNAIQTAWQFQKGRWDIQADVYGKMLDGFIYLIPVYPPQLTIRGAFPSFRYVQADATMWGIDASVGYALNHHLTSSVKYAMIRARNRVTNEWLIQMPADRLDISLQYEFNNSKRFRESYARIALQHVWEQTRVPVTGNIEITNPDGTKEMASDYAPPPPGYNLVNLEAGTHWAIGKRVIHVVLSVNNLLNQRYRDYMNVFRYYALETGINAGLKMKIPLFNKISK